MKSLIHFLRELLPHAAWDLIRHVVLPVVGSIIISLVYWIIAGLGHAPINFLIIIFLFIVSLLLFVGIIFFSSEQTAIRPPDPAPNPQPIPQTDTIDIRLIRAYPVGPDTKWNYPLKVRCEFQNASTKSVRVRTVRWIPGSTGINAQFIATTLQLRIGSQWCPEGVEEVHVPPTEYFRAWISPPHDKFSSDELKRGCDARNLGTMVLLIDGQEYPMNI